MFNLPSASGKILQYVMIEAHLLMLGKWKQVKVIIIYGGEDENLSIDVSFS